MGKKLSGGSDQRSAKNHVPQKGGLNNENFVGHYFRFKRCDGRFSSLLERPTMVWLKPDTPVLFPSDSLSPLSDQDRLTENCHSEPVRAKNLASQPA